MVSKIIIAGGGIGGLTLAVALRRRGVHVTCLERMPDLEQGGAGLALSSNATRELVRLGLESATSMGEFGGRMAAKCWHAMRARLVQAGAGPQADAASNGMNVWERRTNTKDVRSVALCLRLDLRSGERNLTRVEIIVGPAHGAEMPASAPSALRTQTETGIPRPGPRRRNRPRRTVAPGLADHCH